MTAMACAESFRLSVLSVGGQLHASRQLAHTQRVLTVQTADPAPDALRHTISPQLQERDADAVVTRGSRRAKMAPQVGGPPPSHARAAREMPMMTAL